MTFNEERSAAIRDGLVATVTAPRLRPVVRRRLAGAALLVSGLLVGGAVSAAAAAIISPSVVISGTDIPAPPGVLPGEPIVSVLGDLTTVAVDGTTTIPLPSVPAGATHVRVSVACLSAGVISWGFDPSGNNPSSGCDGEESSQRAPWMDFDLGEAGEQFYVSARDGVRAIVTLQFLNYIETDLGVNANGETFGVERDGRPLPDLVAVSTTDASGEELTAYAHRRDLEAFGPDWPRLPNNPTEATQWQAERDERYPNGWEIPVYDSDGVTQLGTMHIG